jgi:2-oxoacid:acceptor oxidoreductase delta subunit (pyruvate/2-ketoisovalerate family)
MMENKEPKVVKTFAEVVDEVKKRNYNYMWRPETVDDVAAGSRCCACQGVPYSAGADLMLREYDVTIDQENCTQCGNCWVYCPLGVVYQDEDGNFVIDEEYCRACGVCVEECPVGVIKMTKIVR